MNACVPSASGLVALAACAAATLFLLYLIRDAARGRRRRRRIRRWRQRAEAGWLQRLAAGDAAPAWWCPPLPPRRSGRHSMSPEWPTGERLNLNRALDPTPSITSRQW